MTYHCGLRHCTLSEGRTLHALGVLRSTPTTGAENDAARADATRIVACPWRAEPPISLNSRPYAAIDGHPDWLGWCRARARCCVTHLLRHNRQLEEPIRCSFSGLVTRMQQFVRAKEELEVRLGADVVVPLPQDYRTPIHAICAKRTGPLFTNLSPILCMLQDAVSRTRVM